MRTLPRKMLSWRCVWILSRTSESSRKLFISLRENGQLWRAGVPWGFVGAERFVSSSLSQLKWNINNEKVTALTSGANTPFNVSGQVHPGLVWPARLSIHIRLNIGRRLAAEDAKKIIIPHIVLASNSEDVNIVKEYADILVGPGKPSVVESYLNMHHGVSIRQKRLLISLCASIINLPLLFYNV